MTEIEKVFFGAKDEITGSCGSVTNLFMENYGTKTQITGGILADTCTDLLKNFFAKIRNTIK
ncbi:MAG: hypothetical protein LBC71_07140 [Oscillospiraceae bacterium]|jgi:tRNA(adenine34) deaminase|nr:hypothetical protein [Oscillospiraceae bacterium]